MIVVSILGGLAFAAALVVTAVCAHMDRRLNDRIFGR